MKLRRGLVLLIVIMLTVGSFPTVSVNTVSAACVTASVKAPQLMYHMIARMPADALLPDLWVEPNVFRQTLRLLRDKGWHTLTSKEIALRVKGCEPIPSKTFAITIDDGNRNGYDNAFPILKEFGFSATFAVVVRRVGVYKSSLDWQMLAEMQAAGMEIADHSWSHSNLAAEDSEGLLREVQYSAEVLKNHLGEYPVTFVYPSGRYNSAVVLQVKVSGFWSALTTNNGCMNRYSNRFVWPRVRVHRTSTPSQILSSLRYC